MRVPRSIDDITESWVSSALGASISLHGVVPIGEAYGFASRLFRLTLEGVAYPSVVVKLWAFSRQADATEVSFYRSIAPSMVGQVPRCHYADADARHGVLVLEDLSRARQGDVLVPERPERLTSLAAILAGYHARWWGSRALGEQAWLRHAVRPIPNSWFPDRRRRLAEQGYLPDGDLEARLLEAAQRVHAVGTDLVSAHPPTLIHADLHLDNIFFLNDRPVLLDWARCGVGPGAQDLVALLFTMCEASSLAPVAKAYQTALAAAGVELGQRAFGQLLGGAALRAFVFWTLGTAAWLPESDRAERLRARSWEDAGRLASYLARHQPELIDMVLD